MQRLNHFNGMLEICRKKSLLQNISTMAKLFPKHFRFIPTTFALPEQLQDLRADMKATGGSRTYILKPSGGCQVKLLLELPLAVFTGLMPQRSASRQTNIFCAAHCALLSKLCQS